MFSVQRNVAEEISDILKVSRKCLQSIWDVNTRLSDSLQKGNFESLTEGLDAREIAIQELQILRDRLELLNERVGKLHGIKGEIAVIVKEIHKLGELLISQGEKNLAALQWEMDKVSDHLKAIRKGKIVIIGYQHPDKKARSATFTC